MTDRDVFLVESGKNVRNKVVSAPIRQIANESGNSRMNTVVRERTGLKMVNTGYCSRFLASVKTTVFKPRTESPDLRDLIDMRHTVFNAFCKEQARANDILF